MLKHNQAKENKEISKLKETTICVRGKYTMLTAILIMALSINGGLYVGTIAYSTMKAGEIKDL